MGIDILTYAAAVKKAKNYSDTVLSGGAAPQSETLDLTLYGITATTSDLSASAESYAVCHANRAGFNQAFSDARNTGIDRLIIPPGNYPLCYETVGSGELDALLDARGLPLEGYGARFYIVYDDLCTGLNPYYTGEAADAYQLCGKMFAVDSDFCGFTLVGERRQRGAASFNAGGTACAIEGSAGISLWSECRGNVVRDCRIYEFSGDGFRLGSSGTILISYASSVFTAHTVGSDGAVSESGVSYLSPVCSCAAYDLDKPKIIKGNGYTYRIPSSVPFKVHCWGAGDVYLGVVRTRQQRYFYFLPGSSTFRVELLDAATHATDSTATYTWRVDEGFYCDTRIENCEVFGNQRGGMSNLPDGAEVRGCLIHHNGVAFDGMLPFSDSTRFGIDIEDVYLNSITIEKSVIYDNQNGVLYRCRGIRFVDSVIQGSVAAARSLNYQIDFYASGTVFIGACTMTTPDSSGSKLALGCTFTGDVADEIDIISTSDKETTANKVTEITAASNNDQYPSALAVYNAIQAGGGGGGSTPSAGTWRLVRSITLTEQQRTFSITADNNNEAFSLRQCLIKLVALPVTTNTVNAAVWLYVNSDSAANRDVRSSGITNTGSGITTIWDVIWAADGVGVVGGSHSAALYGSCGKDTIEQITVMTADAETVFGVGSTIAVYGLDA